MVMFVSALDESQDIATMSMYAAFSHRNLSMIFELLDTILMLCILRFPFCMGTEYKKGSPLAKLSFLMPAAFNSFTPRLALTSGRMLESFSVWKQNPHWSLRLRKKWQLTKTRVSVLG